MSILSTEHIATIFCHKDQVKMHLENAMSSVSKFGGLVHEAKDNFGHENNSRVHIWSLSRLQEVFSLFDGGSLLSYLRPL